MIRKYKPAKNVIMHRVLDNIRERHGVVGESMDEKCFKLAFEKMQRHKVKRNTGWRDER
jgi:hypothetical protein